MGRSKDQYHNRNLVNHRGLEKGISDTTFQKLVSEKYAEVQNCKDTYF